MPDSGGRSPRAWLRAPPVIGGLLPVHRSHITADAVASITLAAVSIPVVLEYTKIAGMPVVTGLDTPLFLMAVIATRAHTGRHRRVTRGPHNDKLRRPPSGDPRDVLCLLSYQGFRDAISALTG